MTIKTDVLRALFDQCWTTAEEHGWHEPTLTPETTTVRTMSIPERLMLIVSECAEALEEYRVNHLYARVVEGKPEGLTVELADVLIRLGDLLYEHKLTNDFLDALEAKMVYNESRPYRHGNKAL